MTKRETMRGSMHISSNTGDKGEQDVLVPCVPSILTIPRRGIKSCTIPIFPGSVCVSRLCLWKQTTGPPTSRIYKQQKRACTRTHVPSLFPSKRSWKNGMRNGRIMRHIAGPTLSSAAHMLAHRKSFSIDDGGIVSTMNDVRRVSSLSLFLRLFVFSSPYKGDGRITALPDISVIMRFGVVICECENSSTKGTMISIWKIL